MRKLILITTLLSMTGCATVPDQQQDRMQTVKLVVGAVALVAVAGYLGKENHKNKCQNNKAGFYVDNATGRTYTC